MHCPVFSREGTGEGKRNKAFGPPFLVRNKSRGGAFRGRFLLSGGRNLRGCWGVGVHAFFQFLSTTFFGLGGGSNFPATRRASVDPEGLGIGNRPREQRPEGDGSQPMAVLELSGLAIKTEIRTKSSLCKADPTFRSPAVGEWGGTPATASQKGTSLPAGRAKHHIGQGRGTKANFEWKVINNQPKRKGRKRGESRVHENGAAATKNCAGVLALSDEKMKGSKAQVPESG